MQVIAKEVLKQAIKDVWVRALTEVPPDVVRGLETARARESSPSGRDYLDILLQNAKNARENRSLICLDTGVPTFFVRTPLDFPYRESIRAAFDEAVREVSDRDFVLRSVVVHPLTREDMGGNLAANIPLIYAELDNEIDYIEIKALPKGSGSGIWGTLKMFLPSVGVEGVKKFVLDTVVNAGSNPCPPIIVGVGIGGSMEEVARLATAATGRPIDQRHPEPQIAALEQELCEALNMTGIGPMGAGGDTTALSVNIEYSGTHRPWMPVAVNINCWPGRRAVCRIHRDGTVEQIGR